ncbi:hypothetical protein [Alteromonas gracilis]|uniref:hypothetical protein n=1 Tax=Alteromonas gracilis TaxID=1479524 RepID=UPI0037353312
MKDSSITMHTAFPVGMVCTIGRGCLGNPAGTLGVVYENYTIGGHHGVSILFPNGRYDGFSERCIEIMDVVPARLSRALCNYEFIHIGKLSSDFERGIFNHAFSVKAR